MSNKTKDQNTNVLAGMACPKCGSLGPFGIAAECWATVYDSGVEETGDFEWADEAACRCDECQHMATVEDFRIEE